jgi:ACS family hexuronate transporter-like MFS transporter
VEAPVAATPVVPAVIAGRPGYVRWSICALLLLATTINYIDRQVLGILAPTLQREIGWTEVQYGYIVTSFQAAYAIGLLVVGRLLDVIGTKVGFAVAIVVWSVAAMAHGLARSPLGFGMARFALGLGEAGNFPAAIKTVAEWFPRKERALATGIFNGGSNLGAIIAPAVVPWIALTYSWPWAFVLTGAVGFLWLGLWWFLYEPPDRHPRLREAERAHINSDPPEQITPVPWLRLVGFRQTWAFAIAKFLTDPVWWFYLYWVPKFLSERHGIGLAGLEAPLITIYVIADIGSMGGGWLSSHLIRRGWSVDRARKTAMLICALAVTPIVLAAHVKDVWSAVAIISLAAAAHQGWSANLFTLTSDMFPRRAVGSVVGIGGMAGAVGGMLVATATGFLLQATGSYMLVFVLAGLAYLLALGIVHLMVPKVVPVELGE